MNHNLITYPEVDLSQLLYGLAPPPTLCAAALDQQVRE